MTELDAIQLAKRNLEKDPSLAVFIVRDLRVTEDAGLKDLAWAMHKEGCARKEAVWLVDELEKHLIAQEATK